MTNDYADADSELKDETSSFLLELGEEASVAI